MTPEYIAHAADQRVRFIVVAQDRGFAVYRSERRGCGCPLGSTGGRCWVVSLATGQWLPTRAGAIHRADALANVRRAA